MAISQPFKSAGQASVALVAASAAVALPNDGENVLIFNGTGVTVFVDFQGATFSATATSPYVIPAGGRLLVTIGRTTEPVVMWAAAFPASSTSGSVYFMRGDGSTY